MKPNIFARTELASAFEDCGFCLWDIGARGGTDPHFAPFGFAIDAVGFEPDPLAFEKLSPSGQWRSEKFYETALGGANTSLSLNIPKDPAGASFLTHDTKIGARYGLQDLFQVKKVIDVRTITIDWAVAEKQIPPPNMLKLDVEGLELDVLRGATEALKRVVAIKLEAAFMRHRVGQAVAGEIIAFLEGYGLYAVDLVDTARWRTQPWAGDPYLVKAKPTYSRGRLAQADLIFLREPSVVTREMARSAALAAIGLGYFDHGLELFMVGAEEHAEDFYRAAHNASKTYGNARARQAIRENLSEVARLCRSLINGLNIPKPTD